MTRTIKDWLELMPPEYGWQALENYSKDKRKNKKSKYSLLSKALHDSFDFYSSPEGEWHWVRVESAIIELERMVGNDDALIVALKNPALLDEMVNKITFSGTEGDLVIKEEPLIISRSGTGKEYSDPVNNPSHYKKGKFEVIDIIEAYDLNFRLANCTKYILRHKDKGKPLEDLKKAQWYLNREIAKLEENGI